MKILKLAVVIFLIGCSQFENKELEENSVDKVKNSLPQICILGTFHFANTTDYSAIVVDSLSSERRQKEIKEIVSNLIEFSPTKILVERMPEFSDTLNQRLESFKKGEFKLPNNELYQIGFRLAKELNHNRIYGIDYEMGLGDEELIDYLTKENLMIKFQSTIGIAKEWANTHSKFLKENSLNEMLTILNSNDSENFNKNLYLDKILGITDKGNSPASEYVSNWWKRNIFIKKNIDDLISDSDRILVIIGAGHSSILKDFYRNSDAVNHVEINQYLR